VVHDDLEAEYLAIELAAGSEILRVEVGHDAPD
jgi:hypothetical protein